MNEITLQDKIKLTNSLITLRDSIWSLQRRLRIDNNEIKPIYDDFLKIFDESREVTYEEWTKRPLFHKIVQPLLYLFSPLM